MKLYNVSPTSWKCRCKTNNIFFSFKNCHFWHISSKNFSKRYKSYTYIAILFFLFYSYGQLDISAGLRLTNVISQNYVREPRVNVPLTFMSRTWSIATMAKDIALMVSAQQSKANAERSGATRPKLQMKLVTSSLTCWVLSREIAELRNMPRALSLVRESKCSIFPLRYIFGLADPIVSLIDHTYLL